MSALYNEIDPYAADWLGNLIAAGHIAPGTVDTRSIVDLRPADVAGHAQCHFFAGIAGWSLALRLAGWPDDLPVWTGSCPCQPFSAAGQRKGFADERHLWPAWLRLIRQCRPAIVFGEQVGDKAARDWFSVVRSDLETAGYCVGAANLCAAGVGAPIPRHRLWFVAQRMERASGLGWQWREEAAPGHDDGRSSSLGPKDQHGTVITDPRWDQAEWIVDREGCERPVEPGTFPLAHGIPGRVGRLRAYGNAIVPQVAASFITAVMDSLPHLREAA